MTMGRNYKSLFSTLMVCILLSSCSELNDAPPEQIVEKLTYTDDIKEIFDNNCISCHSGAAPPAGYDMTSYEGVITNATAGDMNSVLITKSIEGGSMHGFYDSNEEIDKVIQWVVVDSLAL